MSKKLSQLTAITTNTNADLLYIARGNNSYKITYQDFIAGLTVPANNLSSVLAVGALTNEIPITSNNGYSSVSIKDVETIIKFDDTIGDIHSITINAAGVGIASTNLVAIDSEVFSWTSDNEGFAESFLYADATSFEITSPTSGISLHGSPALAWTEYIDMQTNSLLLHSDGISGKIILESKTINIPTAVSPSTVPYIDASNNLVSSAITPTELGYITGASSNLQAQIDALVSGLSWKQAVRVATTGAGTLASSFENGDTIDGVVLATGNRILIKDQASATENGIYTVNASGAPTRSLDMNSGAEFISATVAVSEGTTNQDTQWVCTNDSVTIGVTNIVFVAVGGTTYVGTTNRITVTGNVIDIAATYVGQSSITTLGTITTGTWNGTALTNTYLPVVTVAKGGTGLTTFGGTNKLLYTTTTDNISAITTGNTSVLTTDGSGVPSWTAQGTSFNKAFGTGATDVCVGNDARLSDSRHSKLVAYINTDSSAVTGTTSETYITGVLVPSLNANSILKLRARFTKTGVAGVATPKLYYNTTNDMAGSPVLLGTGVFAGASNYAYFERIIVYKNSLSLCTIFKTTVAAVDDRANNASALSAPNVDLSGKYLVFSVTPGNAGDSTVCADIQLEEDRP